MARAIEQLKQAMEACELGALSLPDQIDALMDAGKAVLQEVSTLTPPNEPLTLEQLREMKGQPVWTVTTGLKGSGRWELVCDVDYEDVLEMASCVDGFYHIEVNTYGSTWKAYRRPPEGKEDT